MTTRIKSNGFAKQTWGISFYGWLGMSLILIFWILNWALSGLRTYWAFSLWLGYCLTIDGLVLWRTGTSLLKRSKARYLGLFPVSALVWWIFVQQRRKKINSPTRISRQLPE